LHPSYSSPAALLVAMEESLVGSIQPGMFVTMFYGIFDPGSRMLTFASAGHNPTLHYKSATQQVVWYKTEGIPLALVRGGELRASLKDYSISIEPGDLLLESTDGINEAVDDSGEQYGFHRMEEVVKGFAEEGAQAVISVLQKSVDEWEKQLFASDDKTLLVISWPKPVEKDEAPVDIGVEPGQTKLKLANKLWMSRTDGSMHLSIPASFESLDEIGRWLKQCVYVEDLPADEMGLLEQGLYEVCANIAEHSYNLNQSKIIDIWWIPEIGDGQDPLALIDEGDDVPSDDFVKRVSRGYFLIRDQGLPPNVEILRSPDSDRLPMRPDGRGLGLHIIQKIMRKFEYHANTKVGNITIMKFRLLHHQLG
ncbi:MAG: SpoIIE family protein phosphatase, partial [candidate division WOR-3 bacterium]